ncbi:hypothetical protein [Desulfoscipio gibsoniae]|uniref:hypothetical protein n=1 Tax=Desulfoscipio gibsoniae TaxID=102134 RepID=UPI000232B5F8|nr:hypothetical protein [Desulfoscipio gibsoniae]
MYSWNYFLVIGVLERLGDAMGGVNTDESAIVPYVVAEKYILTANVYPRMTAIARDLASVPSAMREITVYTCSAGGTSACGCPASNFSSK